MNEQFIGIKFGGKIPMKVFKFRMDDTNFENWELEYIIELIGILKKGMVVYDIGAENGELTAMVGKIVGGENVHIFEPNIDYFPNIKATWEANGLDKPENCFNGYVFNKSSHTVIYNTLNMLGEGKIFQGCLHPNHIDTPMQTVSLDDYCKLFLEPNVVLMDIEGGELAAVKGGINLIKKFSPTFFISIHKPEYIMHRSNGTKEELIEIFINNGYEAIHLSTDHEEHWKFIKK